MQDQPLPDEPDPFTYRLFRLWDWGRRLDDLVELNALEIELRNARCALQHAFERVFEASGAAHAWTDWHPLDQLSILGPEKGKTELDLPIGWSDQRDPARFSTRFSWDAELRSETPEWHAMLFDDELILLSCGQHQIVLDIAGNLVDHFETGPMQIEHAASKYVLLSAMPYHSLRDVKARRFCETWPEGVSGCVAARIDAIALVVDLRNQRFFLFDTCSTGDDEQPLRSTDGRWAWPRPDPLILDTQTGRPVCDARGLEARWLLDEDNTWNLRGFARRRNGPFRFVLSNEHSAQLCDARGEIILELPKDTAALGPHAEQFCVVRGDTVTIIQLEADETKLRAAVRMELGPLRAALFREAGHDPRLPARIPVEAIEP